MSISTEHEFFIQWHLTERCNLRCTHCYQTGSWSDELTLREISDVISEVDETLRSWEKDYDISFTPSFSVTGGEPFLRGDLSRILEEIGGHGFDIYLLTNGTLVTADKARELARVKVKGVQVSMEGPEKVHDGIRGKGSYASSLRGIRHLLDAGLKVTINATVSELNAGALFGLVDVALLLGVRRMGFSRLVPSGRGLGLLDQMMTADRVEATYRELLSLSPEGLEIVTGDPVASQMSCSDSEDSGSVARSGCAAGLSGLTFLPDGTIVPCRRLHLPIGNVRTDALREVWATSPVLEALRDRSRYSGKCGSCPRWADCRGCRAIAYAHAAARGRGDFLAEDPQCFI